MVQPKEVDEPTAICLTLDPAERGHLEKARRESESLNDAALRLLLVALERAEPDQEPAPARAGVASQVDRAVTLMERVAGILWTPGHDRSDFRIVDHANDLVEEMGLPPSWQREEFKQYVTMAPDGKPRANRTLLTEFFNRKAEAARDA